MEEEQINQEQNLEATNIDVDEVIENFYTSNPNTQETTPAETYQHTTPIDTSAATSDTTSDIEQAVNSNDSISDSDTDTDISDTDTNNTNNSNANNSNKPNESVKDERDKKKVEMIRDVILVCFIWPAPFCVTEWLLMNLLIFTKL